ncbi:mobilization protein [Rubellimicrobium rubrum]|uniref:mobilization protein n=1 Tax=Rubellimicrobium rubrum TaxID=2585369 RepID=UPI001FEA789A|nr:mobilization protein [Rubellimicrobium rubrum]
MTETELERAEKRYAQAKARLQALRNRAATEARKLDTRRKVILGGALVDLAARDQHAAAMLDRLVRNLPREQDRKAFVGWKPGDALPEDGAADGSIDGADASAGEADTDSAAALASSARGA